MPWTSTSWTVPGMATPEVIAPVFDHEINIKKTKGTSMRILWILRRKIFKDCSLS
jgi:hypothetical protein